MGRLRAFRGCDDSKGARVDPARFAPHRAHTPDVRVRTLNRLGQLQNLWDKALEAKKDVPLHPLLREYGLSEGIGTLARQGAWGAWRGGDAWGAWRERWAGWEETGASSSAAPSSGRMDI